MGVPPNGIYELRLHPLFQIEADQATYESNFNYVRPPYDMYMPRRKRSLAYRPCFGPWCYGFPSHAASSEQTFEVSKTIITKLYVSLH